MDAPVERKLEGPPVEASVSGSVAGRSGQRERDGAQDVYSGAHGDSMLCVRIGRGRGDGGWWSQCVSAALLRCCEVAGLGGFRLAPLTSSGAALPWAGIKSLSPNRPRRSSVHATFSFLPVSGSRNCTARHVWPAVSPPSALRRALCAGSARRCASCAHTACCA